MKYKTAKKSSILASLFTVAFLGFSMSAAFDDYITYNNNVSMLDNVTLKNDEDKLIYAFMKSCYSTIFSNYTACANDVEGEIDNVAITHIESFFSRTGREFYWYADKDSQIWQKMRIK